MHFLKPTKFQSFNKDIFGFDIETYDNNKKFYCASLYRLKDGMSHIYFSKDDFIANIKTRPFENSVIVATNLGFDYFGTFFNSEEQQKFSILMRGSSLLSAKTYIKGGEFVNKGKRKLLFLDTINYSPMSVEGWGKLLGVLKLKKPISLGRIPRNNKEKLELVTYNKRDAEVSAKALSYLYNTFQRLGATPKMTIASTAKSLFTNKYLKDLYYTHFEYILRNQFKGYFGGRTEAFCRGKFTNYNYYDFNSLYPSVMLNEFPDPKSIKISHQNTVKYIDSHEGMSQVTIYCPYMDYPLLPFRHDDKLMFSTGTFKGWYTHLELRKALDLGYVITKVHDSYYYKDTCMPFYDYVKDMYALRMEYKKAGNKGMDMVCKLFLNSLYGKFGQKFTDKDNLIPCDNMTLKMIQEYGTVERIGDFFRVKKDVPPAPFCIPIWASYVTAYGRIKLHDYIKRSNPLYVDTDSLITKKEFDDSTRLGALKLEHTIKEGVIVRPKFYMFKTPTEEFVKIKGVPKTILDKNNIQIKMTSKDFMDIVTDKKVRYIKFMKIREALRRGFIPNETQEFLKQFSLNDNKRNWYDPFDINNLGYSSPIDLNETPAKELLLTQSI